MPRSVTLPDGSIFPNVPDHVSDEMAIKEAVRRGYIAPPEGALGSFAKNLAGSSLSGIAGLMATGEELMGRNKASDITRGLQDYAKTFQAGPDVSEVAERALHGDLSGIKYALPAIAGQAIPTLASFMFPAGVVSKVAGAAKLSAGATKALQSATALGVGTQAAEGQSILERAEKGLPMDPSHTLAPSVGQGALDAFALSKVLGLGSKVAPTGLLRRAGETAVAEGLTEPVQSMLGHYAALSDTASPEEIAKALASPEARKGYLGDILAGGLGGGVLGGVGHFTGAHSAELANVNMLAQQALARPRWEDTAPKEREAFAIFNGLNPKEETDVATEWARQRNEFKTKDLTENASDEKLTGTATEEAENKKNVLEEANAVTPEITPSRPTQPAEFAPAEDPNMLPDEVLLEAWSDPESRAALTPYQRRRALDLVVARGETARSNEKKPWESYLLDTLKARAAQQIATEEAGSKQSNIAGIANILHQISQGQLTTPNIPAEQLLGMPAAETAQPMGAEDVTKLQRIADVSGLLQQVAQKNAPSPEQLLGMPAEKTAQPMSAEDVTKLQRIADVSGLLQQITQKNAPSPEQLLGMPPAESQVPLNSIEASAQQASMRKLLTDQGIVYAGAPDAASLGTTTGAQPGTTITDEDMARAAKLYAAQAEVPMVTPEVIAAAGIPKSLSPKLNKALDENNGRIPLGHPVIKNLIPKHQESLRKALENFQPAPAQAAEVSPNLPVDQAAEIPEVPNQPALTEGVPDASQIQSAVAPDAGSSTQPVSSQVLGSIEEGSAGVPVSLPQGQEITGESQPVVTQETPVVSEAAVTEPVQRQNPNLLYSKVEAAPKSGETVGSLYQGLKKAFGKHTAKLTDAGRIRLVKDGLEAARLLGRAIPENVTAITDNNGIAYFIADRIQKHELPGLVLHEVGTHVGLRDMVGDTAYNEMLRQAQAGKGEAFDKARKAAETYPEHERAEETLAYIAQNAPNTPLVRKLIAHVKNWLFKTFPNLKLKLNEHDLRVMAVAAVKHAGKGVPMHINRQSPAFAKAQVPSAKAAKEFTKDLTYNSGGTIRRAVLSLQSLDQVLDIPRIQDSANALLAPMRRVSGMQHAMRLDSDKLERRIADVVQRDYESNARLGDFATLATLTNYFPSDQPMSAADVAKQTKDMTKEEATTYEKDVRELEKQWASMGKTARGKEMREVLKDTFAQNRKNLDAFNEAMKLRFANNPGMLKLYDEFYQQVKNKVYFPIMRFGDFVVNSFDVNGNPAFYRFDSEAEARRFAEQEMKKHPGKLIDFGAARDRDMMFNDSDEVALKAMTDALAKLKSSSAAIKARNQIDELLSKLDRDPSSVTDVELKNLINQFPNQDFAQIKKLINAADAFAVKRDALKLKHLMDALPRDDIDMAETLRGLMLAQMPSRSIMKHMIRRKGMPGYSNDFARIVSAYNAKVNNQIPRLHNRKAVFEGKRTVETALRQAVQDNVLRPDLAREILNKVDNEVKTSMSPPDVSPVILALNRVGFRRYLATPGAALMQTSSVPLLSLPVLSGKYGFDASSSALKKAFDIYLAGSAKRRGKGDDWYMAGIGNGLDVVGLNPKTRQEYKDAWNEFTSSGLITHGEAQQALGGGRKPTYDAKGMGKYLNAADKLMGFTDKLFTEAESMPRQVTAMASYMLARKAGVSHAQAIKEATDLTYSALGDYSDIGRPAIFKGNLGRAVYQFQSYGQKFITQQAKLFKTAFMEGGVDPSLPKEQQKLLKARAARTLAGIWATHGVLAGAAGLPFAGLVGAALEALEDWMDPDEYHDMEQQIRSFVRNDIGLDEFMTRMFMNGLPGAMLDWNISPRIGAGDLLMRNDLDKKTAAENLKQFVFDTLGPAVAIFSDTFKAMDYLQEGETYRFYEQIMPHAWWRSVLAANRYAQEGIRTKEGAHILTPDQLEMADILTKAAGIEPLEVSETREQAYGLKKAELFINERKKSLYNRYFKAAMNHDQDKLAEVSAEIARFRSVHPDVPFDLERSMQSKLKRIQQAEESGIGLVLNEATLKNLTGRHEYEDLIMARQNR